MVYKQLFTDTEWGKIQSVVLWLIRAVARADGKIDPKEIKAMEIICKLAPNFKNPLACEVLASVDKHLFNSSNKFNLSLDNMREKIFEFADLIDKKIYKEASIEFKKTMLAIALFIANASSRTQFDSSNIDETEANLIAALIVCLKLSEEELNSAPTLDEISKNFKAVLAF